MNKTRQSGYTTTAGAGEIPWAMIYGKAETIVVLSKSENEALGLMEKFKLAYHSVKDRDPNWSPIVKETVSRVILENGNTFRVLSSSKAAGRSFTGTHLYMDEAAFIMYAREIFEGSFPVINRSMGRYTIFSTPESGTKFEELCTNHEDNGFSFHQYEWWFVPEYNPYYEEFMKAWLTGTKAEADKWIDKARTGTWYRTTWAAIGEQSFMKEYECNFDAGSDKVFTTRQLNAAFKKNYLTRDYEAYGETYKLDDLFTGYSDHVVFIDYGRKRDPTVIGVFAIENSSDCWKLIAYQRIRPSIFVWSQVIETIMDWFNLLKEPDMYHDGTGSGDALTLELAGYSNPIMISDTVNSRIKTNAIVNMTRAFDNEAIILPKIEQLYNEFKAYKWKDTGIVQDSVMVVMMMLMKCYTPDDSYVGVDTNFSFVGGA